MAPLEANVMEHAPHHRWTHFSFAPFPPGHARVVIVVILSQIFNNLNTGGKCQLNMLSSHYMPVLVTATRSIHLLFSQGIKGIAIEGRELLRWLTYGSCAESDWGFWGELLKPACFTDEESEWKWPLKDSKKGGITIDQSQSKRERLYL